MLTGDVCLENLELKEDMFVCTYIRICGGSVTDRIWDKQRFQILRFSNLKSQKFSKISKFQENDLIIEQILYLA